MSVNTVSTQFLLKFYALPLINMLCRSNNKTFCLWKHCSPAGSRMRRHLIPGSQREVSDDIDTKSLHPPGGYTSAGQTLVKNIFGSSLISIDYYARPPLKTYPSITEAQYKAI